MKPHLVAVVGRGGEFEKADPSLFKASSVQGKLYKKEVIRFGKYKDPLWGEYEMEFDEEWANAVVQNFRNGIPGRVPTPASHTDDPEKNRGEIIDYEVTRRGLVAYFDIRSEETIKDIEEGRIWDDSISFTDDYVDNKGNGHGPAIVHIALVNNPYIDKLGPFEALSRMTDELMGGLSALAKSQGMSAMMLSRSGNNLNRDKNMDPVKVKNTRDFAVPVKFSDAQGNEVEETLEPGQETEVSKVEQTKVEEQIKTAKAPAGGGEDGKENQGGDSGAGDGGNGGNAGGDGQQSGDLSAKNQTDLAAENKRLRAEKLEGEIDSIYNKALSEGKVTPAQEKSFKSLARGQVSLSRDGKVEIAESLTEYLKSAGKVVDFSENGSQNRGKNDGDSEVPKYENLSEEQKAGLKALSITPERFDKVSKENPTAFADLINSSEK